RGGGAGTDHELASCNPHPPRWGPVGSGRVSRPRPERPPPSRWRGREGGGRISPSPRRGGGWGRGSPICNEAAPGETVLSRRGAAPSSPDGHQNNDQPNGGNHGLDFRDHPPGVVPAVADQHG